MTSKKGRVARMISEATNDAIKHHCAATGDREYELAEDLGCSASHLSNLAHGTAAISADLLVRLVRTTDDKAPAHVIATLCGGFFVPAPDAVAGWEYGAARDLAKRFQQTMDEWLSALDPSGDGGAAVTEAESERFDRVATEYQALIERMLNEMKARVGVDPALGDRF